VRSALLFLCLLSLCTGIAAAETSRPPWRYLGHDVSVRVWPVTGVEDAWTWDFRNDGTESIRYLEFSYVTEGSDGTTVTRTDVVPRELRPGHVIGGSVAFVAESISRPIIEVKDVNKRSGRHGLSR
jgi:hypothetical protein